MSDLRGVLNQIMEDFNKKIVTSIPLITSQIALDLEPKFKEIVSTAIDGFYMNAQPKVYNRTGNFDNMKNSVKVSSTPRSIIIEVGEDTMSDYPGMYNQSLDASTAFDYFYMNGEHGHGKWCIGYSYPPDEYVESQLNSAEIDNIIGNSIDKVLNTIM